MDREKVINGLESCVISMTKCFFNKNEMCPYASVDVLHCEQELMRDALALLKEQEAVEPVKQIEQTEWTVCGNCRNHIISRWKFCPYCGRSVKWE